MKDGRKRRTTHQNAALHLYCEHLAEALNDAGFEMKAVLEAKSVDVPWNKSSVKEVLWRPIMQAMTGKDSTTDMNTVDPSEVYEVLNRHIAENFHISVPWPSEESMDDPR